jgi:ATP-dependent Clp protease protease subunit
MIRANLVPMVIEETRRGERAFDIFSRLLKDRIIFLNGSINMVSANLLIAQMLFLEKENDQEDIYLYINSQGGQVYPGMAIYDTMQFIKPDVVTVGTGLVASMASILLAAGAKGKRTSLPHTKVMIHQPWGGIEGKATDMRIAVEEMIEQKEILENTLQKHTGQPIKKIRDDMERGDFWMTADSAKKYGIIDKVL